MAQKFKVSLLFDNPSLAAEFDVGLNGLSSDEVSASEIKIRRFWKCKVCTHIWQTSVSNRNYWGNGCPCCSGNICVPHINSLAVKNPVLAKEWHPTLNNDKTPYDYLPGANKKVWWLCSICSHDFPAVINTRNSQGTGCPSCSSSRRTSFPEMAIYYYIKQIFGSTLSGSKVDGVEVDVFIPELGVAIEYDGLEYHKNRLHKDLEKNVILKEYKFIRVREFGLPLVEEHNCVNLVVKPRGSNLNAIIEVIFDILCDVSTHAISAPNINTKRDQIEIRSLFVARLTANSVAEKRPDLIKHWGTSDLNGNLTPYNTSHGSATEVYWLCDLGHSWSAPVYSITCKDSIGCSVCTGKTVKEGFNDLSTTHPMIAKEFGYHIGGSRSLTQFSSGSNESVHWICSCCGEGFDCPVYVRTGKWAQDCKHCKKEIKPFARLFIDDVLVGVRFIYGRRYADVTIESLLRYDITLDLNAVQKFDLSLVNDRYLSEDESVRHIRVEDYSENERFFKRLKISLSSK